MLVSRGAHKNYHESELSSSEFSLVPAAEDKEIVAMAASETRGFEEIYCSAIVNHRQLAVPKVVEGQRDKKLRSKLSYAAAAVSTRSKNFARLVAVGDAEAAMAL